MKTLVIFSNCSFPVSAVAGSILTGKLSDQYRPGEVWDALPGTGHRDYADGRACLLGSAPDGTRVAAFTARSGRVILKNMIESFLENHQIRGDRCRVLEINTPASPSFFLGQLILGVPLAGRAGRYLVEKHIEKIYPQLVKAVKLDCNCQISDN